MLLLWLWLLQWLARLLLPLLSLIRLLLSVSIADAASAVTAGVVFALDVTASIGVGAVDAAGTVAVAVAAVAVAVSGVGAVVVAAVVTAAAAAAALAVLLFLLLKLSVFLNVAIAFETRVVVADVDIIGTIPCSCFLLLISKFDYVCKNVCESRSIKLKNSLGGRDSYSCARVSGVN